MKSIPAGLAQEIASIECDIAQAPVQQLLVLQPKLQAVLRDLAARGYDIPARLRVLEDELECAAVEAQFDNLPL